MSVRTPRSYHFIAKRREVIIRDCKSSAIHLCSFPQVSQFCAVYNSEPRCPKFCEKFSRDTDARGTVKHHRRS